MKRTKKPLNNSPKVEKEVSEELLILKNLQGRLHAGSKNPNLKSAELLLVKKEVDVLYGFISATIDYHKMTKQ